MFGSGLMLGKSMGFKGFSSLLAGPSGVQLDAYGFRGFTLTDAPR